jgi:hypothetical protein
MNGRLVPHEFGFAQTVYYIKKLCCYRQHSSVYKWMKSCNYRRPQTQCSLELWKFLWLQTEYISLQLIQNVYRQPLIQCSLYNIRSTFLQTSTYTRFVHLTDQLFQYFQYWLQSGKYRNDNLPDRRFLLITDVWNWLNSDLTDNSLAWDF